MPPETDPSHPVTIACIQFEPKIGEVDANLDAIEDRVRQAVNGGAILGHGSDGIVLSRAA